MPVVHEAVRAELAARRRGTASTKTRGQVSGGGAKPWRQKGTGRARAGSSRLAGLDRRRHRVRSDPSRLHLQGQPQGPANRAAQRAVGSRRARVGRRVRRSGVRRAVDQAGGRAARRLASRRVDAGGARRAGGGRRQVVPEPPAGVRDAGEDAGVADVIGAASLLVSQAALPALVARAKAGLRPRSGRTRADGREPDHHPPGRLREDLRARRGRQVHVPGRRVVRTRRRSARPSRSCSTSRSSRSARRRSRASPSAAARTWAARAMEEGDRAGAARATRSRSSDRDSG